MEDFHSESSPPKNRSKDQSSPFEEIDVKHESPEEMVAESVSQQLLSNAFEYQKKETEAQEVDINPRAVEQTLNEPLITEPFQQNFDIQNEQRFSGIPIQQYIYDEEEEDEEESDEDIDIHPIETQRKEDDLLAFKASPPLKSQNEDNLFDLSNEPQNQPKEEILYQLSDDNVLIAQSYGIGSDLRISSTGSETNLQEVTAYELNSDDPFSTPQKHKTETNKQTEEEFERFIEKSEPFETIATDFSESKPRPSTNLLDFGRMSDSKPIEEQVLESHSIVESMVESIHESKPEPNHALTEAVGALQSDKRSDVLPSSVVDTEFFESHIHSVSDSTNKSDSDFNPTSTPNLDYFEPTLTSSTHFSEQAFPETQITSSSKPIETIEESPISSSFEKQSFAAEPQQEIFEQIITPKMSKPTKESEHAVSTSTNEGNCPFSPSAWFNPNQLNPTVAELVYWRDPKKSGAVFGAGLAILLSLTVFSIISVIAYTSLATLSVTLSFRIYKNILQAVQKTNEGHPFKEYLEVEITPSSERIHEIVDSVLSHTNCTLNKLRSVFLVEDIIDSLKFVVLFWCLTYIGSWFNGLTLLILAYLGLFALPKVYEMNKTQIDQYVGLACSQISDITSKIRAKIPFPAKKDKEN